MGYTKGFIVIHREILDWEWYSDMKTKLLFFHLLLTANHKEKKWQGKTIGKGELITSIAHLAAETGLSEREVRTALNHLKSTGEITMQSTNRYTLINVVNWGKYQDYDTDSDKQNDTQADNQPTISRQTTDKQATTTEQRNKETKEQYIESRAKSTRFVPPTVQEVAEYIAEKNYVVNAQRFVDFYESKNWFVGKNKMKDWKAAVRSWQSREKDSSDFRSRNITESVKAESRQVRAVPQFED